MTISLPYLLIFLLIVYKKLYHSLNQPQLILPMISPNSPTSWLW